MKNKKYATHLTASLLITAFFCLSLYLMNKEYLMTYNINNNRIISSIIANVKEEYPDIDEEEIVKILNTKELKNDKDLIRYGIDPAKDVLSKANDKLLKDAITTNLIFIITYVIMNTLLFSLFNYSESKKIKKITNYIKEINNRNYELDIASNSEDDLSILKNEIYKTAVTLNEQAHLLKNDKESLKDSLSDISHQLKTPLTSITLMIDTLLDSKDLSNDKKKEILNNIHRKIASINFLIHSLLKLSKFDANTVVFTPMNNKVSSILNEVQDNLDSLSDLKDIKIKIKGNKTDKIYCDFKWQVEALTNIVKNCLEYSPASSSIDITYGSNDLFTKIVIKDYGIGMDDEDRRRIFDRFYKGKNSSSDSVGIGLALAKVIIEHDNGYIVVDSKKGEGTTFTIKYMK